MADRQAPQFTEEGILRCPACDGWGMHIDDVLIATGNPDKGGVKVRVDAVRSSCTVNNEMRVPGGSEGHDEHRIVLCGWCQDCGEKFGYVFEQNDGSTEVEVVHLR